MGGSTCLIFRSKHRIELTEDLLQRLPGNVGQHIQSPSMRHSKDKGIHAKTTAAINDLVESWDEHLCMGVR